MKIEVKLFEKPNELGEEGYSLLEKREAENNLPLSLLRSLENNLYQYSDEDPLFFGIYTNQKLSSIALRTPPYNLIITKSDKVELVELNNFLKNENLQIPGVLGPKKEAEIFSKLYCNERGLASKLRTAERIYKLNKVKHPEYPKGSLRLATMDDYKILSDWGVGFAKDAFLDEFHIKNAPKTMKRLIESNSLYVWDEDGIKTMASAQGVTLSGIRVGYVYTPKELRKKGYASAITAALSQYQLDHGRKFCFLFTDLANPTSNSIYKKIGYKEVCDIDMLEFVNRA